MAYNRDNAVPAYLADNTVYQAWWAAIRAQLTAVGMVQTSDTGQLNPASHARPAATNYSGYEIWRFADSLQATLPIFLKLEPGVGTAQDRPAIRFTIGTGTDGAGTLTGQVGTTSVMVVAGSKTSGVTLPSFASHGEGYFHFITNFDINSSNFAVGLFVERPFDNGEPTAEGIFRFGYLTNSTAGGSVEWIPASGTVPAATLSNGTGFPNPFFNLGHGSVVSAIGTDFAVMLGTYPMGRHQRFTCVAVYDRAGDLTGDLVMLDGVSGAAVSMWGESWKYLALGDGLYNGIFGTFTSSVSLAMRAE